MYVISLEKEGFTDPKNTNDELRNINCKDSFSFQKNKIKINVCDIIGKGRFP